MMLDCRDMLWISRACGVDIVVGSLTRAMRGRHSGGPESKGIDVRFSKLRLNGFKSFVDPTDLIIADGLTGVGAATRPARNFAEVSLIIDNGERLAPAAFNDVDQLEIVRRITRDAGSAYKVGQSDVRARDVQMLFADASTGSHSPALVRQGQISELINAKPAADP